MSGPTRPHYRVRIENVDQGWEHVIQHRQALPDWDDVTVLLIDSFEMGWGLESGPIPQQLAADTVTFNLFCKTTDDVPALAAGDRLLVDLDRPAADGSLIPYMHFVGRATDPTAHTDPRVGIILTVSALGMKLDLVGEVDFGTPVQGNSQFVEDGWAAAANASGGPIVPMAGHEPPLFDNVVTGFGKHSVQEATNRFLNSAIDLAERYTGVLRYAWDWANRYLPGAPPGYSLSDPPPTGKIVYYLDKWDLEMPPPLSLMESAGDPDEVVLGPHPAAEQITTLSASVVQTPTDWSKSRGDNINMVNLTALVDEGNDQQGPLAEGTYVATDPTSIDRYGPTVRDVSTFLSPVLGVAPPIGAYMPPSAGPTTWSIPDLEVLPGVMDDDELDELAPTFYPHPEPIRAPVGRFVILTGIHEGTAIAGTDLAMQITGCTFRISRGILSITPSVRPMPTPDFATSITYGDLERGALDDTFWSYPVVWADLADTTWDSVAGAAQWTSPTPDQDWTGDTDGHYISPSLDWDELTYTDA